MSLSKAALLAHQKRHFQTLLQHVWRRSAFYHDFYGDHGFREKDLSDVSASDLPILPKKTLIDNFDRAVTDPRLRKRELEEWFARHRDPSVEFLPDMVVLHGSGTSGDLGIFAYDRKGWTTADATIAARLPLPEQFDAGRTRIAFYVAAHGHFATVCMAASMPPRVYDTLILSLLDSTEQTLRQLNVFQPHRLTGYSSSVARLAELALDGRLDIHPQRIFVGGDRLTGSMERKIRAAWKAPIYSMYAASESKYIALKTPEHDQFMVMDELNIVEVLDDDDRPVGEHEEGRVLLTNLYNFALPILRYDIGDYVVKGTPLPDIPFSTLREIKGRVNDALPVRLSSGAIDSIHPIVVTTFHVPSIEKFQFVSADPDYVRINYVAPKNLDAAVRHEFQQMLDERGASQVDIEVQHVPDIPNDPQTGKLRLVVLEGTGPHADRRRPPDRIPFAEPSHELTHDVEGNASFEPFARAELDRSIAERFEQQVRKHPNRQAVSSGAAALTYSELNRAANRVARAILVRRGPDPETIGVLIRPGISAVSAILAILKAGKCYLPLDVSYPPVRLASILHATPVSLLVTSNEDMSQANALVPTTHVLNIDAVDAAVPSENPGLGVSPDSPAYVFFTSGSTGQPKRVVHTHRHGLHQIMSYTNGLQITPADRVAQLHSHAFSASRLDIFGALLNGAALCPVAVAERGMGHIARRVIEERITLLHWVPTAFRRFAETLGSLANEDLTRAFHSVRVVVLGSEPLTRRDIDLYRLHCLDECVLVNRFGSTETGNICWYFIDKRTGMPAGPVPVGHPIDDVEVHLLDEQGRDVPTGSVGEITVRSLYLNTDASDTLYRTGDLGRLQPDGCLVHLGRRDLQVKIRGHRVELGEIERALLEHPAITSAAVTLRQDDPLKPRLVAYYVLRDAVGPTRAALRTFLDSRLPGSMVPTDFVRLESLPLTASGKVDRSRLAGPDHSRVDDQEVLVAPRSDVEHELTAIWRSVLGVEAVGIHNNFFELGGDSLHAMMILTRAADALHCEFSFQEFFEQPTIAHMAAMADRAVPKERAPLDRDAIIAMVESLSDEEARQILKQKGVDLTGPDWGGPRFRRSS